MINFSRGLDHEPSKQFSEIINQSSRRVRLPRHISAWETKSHRPIGGQNNLFRSPKVCRLNIPQSPPINHAMNILRYQLNDLASQQKHQENVLSNLKRRLEVAQTNGNEQLIKILQEEYRQLEIVG